MLGTGGYCCTIAIVADSTPVPVLVRAVLVDVGARPRRLVTHRGGAEGPHQRTRILREPRCATNASGAARGCWSGGPVVGMLARLGPGVALLALAGVCVPHAAGQAPLPEGVQLVHSGGECRSNDVDLGTFATLSECADACAAWTPLFGGCSFFIYGECTHAWNCGGNCHREVTSDASCPEGWQQGSYDFYSIDRPAPPPAPLPADVQLVHSGGECMSNDVDLGTFANVSACADACVAWSGVCSFFIFGECTSQWGCGGNCHREITSDASCPEGWEADNYNFYSIDRPQSPAPPLPDDVELVGTSTECRSTDFYLGAFATLSECADACVADPYGECSFFTYGVGETAGNCHREITSHASCPEGWQQGSYDFYSIDRPAPPPAPLPADVQLVHSGGECMSIDVDLGNFANVSACADACVAWSGVCNFFIYGECTHAWNCGGNCHREVTSDASCPEGWQTKRYNFYSIDRPQSPAPLPNDVQLVHSGGECRSYDNNLGTFATLSECADACVASPYGQCNFFIYGIDGKAGNCYREVTSDASCPQGWERDSYNFYSISRAAPPQSLPEGVQLVHSGGECLSNDVDLGTFATLSECADACVASPFGGCSFFIYGECTHHYAWNCGGNCHREGTSNASCPEGWERDSYNFYSMNRPPPPPPPLPADVQLVHSGGECMSNDVDLGNFATLSECADACVASGVCSFFIYGEGSAWGGNCHREGTSDASCPEGWEVDSYNFYSIDRAGPPPPPLPADVQLVHSGGECLSDDVDLGIFATLSECADACVASPYGQCSFFIYGVGQKAGRCYREGTSDASCPESWEMDSYNFYSMNRPPPPLPPLPEGVQLVHSGGDCLSNDVDLGTFATLSECADACVASGGCSFFIYGEGSAWGGNCHRECTSDASCPEGWEVDSYNFYSIDRAGPPPPPLPADVQPVDQLFPGVEWGPKDVIFVLDDSGSMGRIMSGPPLGNPSSTRPDTCGTNDQRQYRRPSRLNVCKQSLLDDIFSTKLHEHDRVGLITFHDGAIPLDHYSTSHRQALETEVHNLRARSCTPLWERMSAATSMMPSASSSNASQWIVALTDGAANGENCGGGMRPGQVASQLQTQDGLNIRVLFITVALTERNMRTIHDTVVRSGNDHIIEADEAKASLQQAWIGIGQQFFSSAMTTAFTGLPFEDMFDIAATITFGIDIADVAEGSAARTAFEADFKLQMAASLGGVPADKIFVDSITAARRRALGAQHDRRALQSSAVSVDFRLVAPASVGASAAGLVASLDISSLQILVGGAVANATSVTSPVTTIHEPDCEGTWSACTASCEAASDRTWSEIAAHSGSGAACPPATDCQPGDGSCSESSNLEQSSTGSSPTVTPAPTPSSSTSNAAHAASVCVLAMLMLAVFI
eukprot:COSAG02_NODE_494_length_21161_cov_48.367534_8_plen_1392_part_00